MNGLPRDTLRRIRKMSTQELNDYLKRLYILGFEDGLREAEKEFDGAVIMDEDEARERLGEEAVRRLLGES
ncbi:MAG: hypothetical protein IKF99_11125 [Oscillospiraceae bacterium]|nr:hypothetical protein [Oscillospiraceae bacterium]